MHTRCLTLFMLPLMIALAPTASAHRLVVNDGSHVDADSALVVTEPDVSQLILHEVDQENQEVWLTFQGQAGDLIYLQLGVPVIEALTEYHPAVALVGPGLPAAELSFAIPGGAGAVTFEAADFQPKFFSEPFTGTESWIYVEETVELPVDGEYFIVGYHPVSAAGKLWVAFGEKEVFGLPDILAYPDTLRTVRAFHEVSNEPLGFIPRLFLIVATLLRFLM
ncbi:MAG: hypothetical protein K1Y02_21995 [Candidatus Hydrogenedentes bacterium]|nr:hypothetical protein [Candidatus Hydrogenedentota bacterium]